MSAAVLELPQLTGTRDRARRLLANSGLPAALEGLTVHLDAGPTLAGTDSFADEMVKILLVERHAEGLVVTLVGPDFAEKFHQAARTYGVDTRVKTFTGAGPAY